MNKKLMLKKYNVLNIAKRWENEKALKDLTTNDEIYQNIFELQEKLGFYFLINSNHNLIIDENGEHGNKKRYLGVMRSSNINDEKLECDLYTIPIEHPQYAQYICGAVFETSFNPQKSHVKTITVPCKVRISDCKYTPPTHGLDIKITHISLGGIRNAVLYKVDSIESRWGHLSWAVVRLKQHIQLSVHNIFVDTKELLAFEDFSEEPAYLDSSHEYYSEELAMAVEAWNAAYIGNYKSNSGHGIKRRILMFLCYKYPEKFGKLNSDKLATTKKSNKAERIATLVNYTANPNNPKKI